MTRSTSLPAKSRAGRYSSRFAKCPTAVMVWLATVVLAACATAGDAPIPDSRFPTYVKFAADSGNNGFFSNQARVDAAPVTSESPIFFAGFFRPEDFSTFGMLVSFGNQGSRGNGLIGLSTQGNALLAFQWSGDGWKELALAPEIWTGGGGSSAIKLNQWSFIAFVLNDSKHRSIMLDGVHGTEDANSLPWPRPGDGFPLSLTFGSYYDTANGGVDAHNFNGGLRDWVAGTGVPTAVELERMRNGEDPVAIWGPARVWGFWRFTANPHLGQKEPDVTGHGHNLTYSDAGSQAGHTLPILVTPASPARPTPTQK